MEITRNKCTGDLKNLPAVRETQVPSLGQEDPPGEGKGNPFQYSCLEIEKAGGLQSVGSQRVGHGWATSTLLVA